MCQPFRGDFAAGWVKLVGVIDMRSAVVDTVVISVLVFSVVVVASEKSVLSDNTERQSTASALARLAFAEHHLGGDIYAAANRIMMKKRVANAAWW